MKFTTTYLATVDDGFRLSEEEVAEVDFFSPKAITEKLKGGGLFHPELRDVWQRFFV